MLHSGDYSQSVAGRGMVSVQENRMTLIVLSKDVNVVCVSTKNSQFGSLYLTRMKSLSM